MDVGPAVSKSGLEGLLVYSPDEKIETLVAEPFSTHKVKVVDRIITLIQRLPGNHVLYDFRSEEQFNENLENLKRVIPYLDSTKGIFLLSGKESQRKLENSVRELYLKIPNRVITEAELGQKDFSFEITTKKTRFAVVALSDYDQRFKYQGFIQKLDLNFEVLECPPKEAYQMVKKSGAELLMIETPMGVQSLRQLKDEGINVVKISYANPNFKKGGRSHKYRSTEIAKQHSIDLRTGVDFCFRKYDSNDLLAHFIQTSFPEQTENTPVQIESANNYVVVLVGKSTAGKSTAIYKLLSYFGQSSGTNVAKYSTRSLRRGEIQGKDLFSVSKKEWLRRKAEGFFIDDYEWGKDKILVGIPDFSEPFAAGKDIYIANHVPGILENVSSKFKDRIVYILIHANEETILSRLAERSQSKKELQKRLVENEKEMKRVLDEAGTCDFVLDTSDMWGKLGKDMHKEVSINECVRRLINMINWTKNHGKTADYVKTLVRRLTGDDIASLDGYRQAGRKVARNMMFSNHLIDECLERYMIKDRDVYEEFVSGIPLVAASDSWGRFALYVNVPSKRPLAIEAIRNLIAASLRDFTDEPIFEAYFSRTSQKIINPVSRPGIIPEDFTFINHSGCRYRAILGYRVSDEKDYPLTVPEQTIIRKRYQSAAQLNICLITKYKRMSLNPMSIEKVKEKSIYLTGGRPKKS